MSKEPYDVYFAGELFSSKHLFGNAVLAEMIWEMSQKRYRCHLPQNLEMRHNTPQSVRDEDIKSVISADIGLFNYDGPELDSGTVVEYLFAKFADIPAVILRTDFRKGGDQESDAWNLMTSFFPRTEVVMLNSMALYKDALFMDNTSVAENCLEEKRFSTSATRMIGHVAYEVIAAMDRVIRTPPMMPPESRQTIYDWLAMLPGFKQGYQAEMPHLLQALQRKMEKNLL